MDRLQRLLHPGMGGEGPPGDSAQVDTSEQVYISSLALIKMLKHGEFQSLQDINITNFINFRHDDQFTSRFA